jgi:predicted secreted Zn-dependent protease
MKATGLLTALVLGGALLGATQAHAINCEQVKRYAATGRTAQQIADSMVVDVGEVQKCLQAAPVQGKETPKAGEKTE